MRITGGIYRSRTLRAPHGASTRPTSDRVREALFGILSNAGAIEGARVLDLYAGTGALALEALSRGAAQATLVESSRDALAAIEANVTALGLEERTLVLRSDVGRAVGRIAGHDPYDLVFADPPWRLVDSGDAPRAIATVVGAARLSDRAIVVVEHAARSEPPTIIGLLISETRRYGDAALSLYKPAILGPPRR
jgi:16S rRNA (guanine966-N2)-methyltransferase